MQNPRKLRSAGRSQALASVPAVLLIPIAITLLWQLQALHASTKWEERQDAVISQRHELNDALAQETDAVSAYLLTGDRNEQADIVRSRSHSAALLAGLRVSIKRDAPEHMPTLRLAEQKYALWRQDTSALAVATKLPHHGALKRLWQRASGHMRAVVISLRPLGDGQDAQREQSIDRANLLARLGLGIVLIGMTLSLAVVWLDSRRSRQLAAVQAHEDFIEAQLAQEREQTLRLEYDTKRAQEANRMKSDFIANMSHELRTPLTAIVGFSDLLLDGMAGTLAKPQRSHITNISRSSLHLLQLINDVLDSALIESGSLRLHTRATDPSAAAREVIDVIAPLALKSELRVELHASEAPACVNVDPARFQQVLYNLLSNAVKFTPAGGRVDVVMGGDGVGGLRVSVIDSGIGIERASLPRLFEPFTQVDSSATKQYRGTGLGLMLTRRLVEAHGGSVDVTSRFGKGSSFTARFPNCVTAADMQPNVAS